MIAKLKNERLLHDVYQELTFDQWQNLMSELNKVIAEDPEIWERAADFEKKIITLKRSAEEVK
ncbi:MAG: hypothetical protein GF307_10875 [candidate division Zixibacteria bacterium]|nr:hypothetical protein [candidate division Zixibacteria bacterium]